MILTMFCKSKVKHSKNNYNHRNLLVEKRIYEIKSDVNDIKYCGDSKNTEFPLLSNLICYLNCT